MNLSLSRQNKFLAHRRGFQSNIRFNRDPGVPDLHASLRPRFFLRQDKNGGPIRLVSLGGFFSGCRSGRQCSLPEA